MEIFCKVLIMGLLLCIKNVVLLLVMYFCVWFKYICKISVKKGKMICKVYKIIWVKFVLLFLWFFMKKYMLKLVINSMILFKIFMYMVKWMLLCLIWLSLWVIMVFNLFLFNFFIKVFVRVIRELDLF